MGACLVVPYYGPLPRRRTLKQVLSRVGVGAAIICLAMTAACHEPTRLPSNIPTAPSEAIYSLAGTVTETEPTTSTRIPNAFVTLDGINSGQSTMSDGDGRFLFPELKNGRFNLVASRDGYVTKSFAIDLMRDSDFAIRLDPVPDMTTETFRGTLGPVGTDCWGESSPKPCQSHSFITHRRGPATARLIWTGNAELSMLMTNGWDTTAQGTREFSVSLGPGHYDVWVVYASGSAPAAYTLEVTHEK